MEYTKTVLRIISGYGDKVWVGSGANRVLLLDVKLKADFAWVSSCHSQLWA